MKTIDDALELRGRILGAFEAAEVSTDPTERERRLTFVVVGAGPTGVEVAGQIVELAERTLAGAFRTIKPSDCRVILLDAAPAVLPPMGPKLGLKAKQRLEKMGVEVQLNAMVSDVDYKGITIKAEDGTKRRIECACKVWAAGVQASSLGKMIAEQSDGTEADRAGRVLVEPDLTVKGHPNVFVIGDLMFVPGVPGMAQGAIQGAHYATKLIKHAIKGQDDPATRKPFKYFDKGSMATISRFNAVAQVGKLEFAGFFAWLAWLVLHLFYLVGHKNRFTAVLAWTISFLGRSRGQMAITSQMIYARVVTNWMEAQTQGALAAAERAEQAEQKAAG
jgi:NADH dehydrogenase